MFGGFNELALAFYGNVSTVNNAFVVRVYHYLTTKVKTMITVFIKYPRFTFIVMAIMITSDNISGVLKIYIYTNLIYLFTNLDYITIRHVSFASMG